MAFSSVYYFVIVGGINNEALQIFMSLLPLLFQAVNKVSEQNQLLFHTFIQVLPILVVIVIIIIASLLELLTD